MHLPAFFEALLEREFGDSTRVRWSSKRQVWFVEQRVGRPAGGRLPVHLITDPDRRAQVADGFYPTMRVQPFETTRCPDCSWPVEVPVMRFKEVTCPYCHYSGTRSGKWILGYFPLNEKLINHFKACRELTDPRLTVLREIDMHNQRMDLKHASEYEERRYDALTEVAERQIPKVGWTGHTGA